MVEWEEKVGETPVTKRNGYNSQTTGQQNQIYITKSEICLISLA